MATNGVIGLNTKPQPASAPIRAETATPTTIPTSPPSSDSVSASIRNWAMTSRPRAPIALRIPISRVRSRTDTSMMFMIPIPPTTSEIEAIPASRIVSVVVTADTVLRSCAWSWIVKSSVPSAAIPWRCSRALWISALARSI